MVNMDDVQKMGLLNTIFPMTVLCLIAELALCLIAELDCYEA